nr:MAG TPA: hypothetical protein [Caudoviricetes sp.]
MHYVKFKLIEQFNRGSTRIKRGGYGKGESYWGKFFPQ